ncbi:hypothetical protein HMPREF0083_05802 [Aneurinibacillus aneurinilyticus ATCC 12856]|uniref:Uncharacterized protein n=1 Tax=Aneurinibacillus aneurinilyticus ATCC 12856 TaxID=649747 RepID=U1WS55_ANEAE|nr:hypothetical protein HMPREF0083_05802 [Aneurinibacillus aneurinilyticus ATCC 12856]
MELIVQRGKGHHDGTQTRPFVSAPAHRPSFFSYLPPQTCVDVSNQMYIIPTLIGFMP